MSFAAVRHGMRITDRPYGLRISPSGRLWTTFGLRCPPVPTNTFNSLWVVCVSPRESPYCTSVIYNIRLLSWQGKQYLLRTGVPMASPQSINSVHELCNSTLDCHRCAKRTATGRQVLGALYLKLESSALILLDSLLHCLWRTSLPMQCC
jgi:hypothetical protein